MKILTNTLYGTIFMLNANILQATEITIEVTDVDVSRGGSIIVMIFNGEEGFPKKHEKAFLTQTDSKLHDSMEFEFDIDVDEIAVKVLHDENNDGKVTKNWTGIFPKDGLGFSNEQRVTLAGAPTYQNSKLLLDEFEDGLVISVIYP